MGRCAARGKRRVCTEREFVTVHPSPETIHPEPLTTRISFGIPRVWTLQLFDHVIRKEAGPFCRTSSSVRLWGEFREPKGPNGW